MKGFVDLIFGQTQFSVKKVTLMMACEQFEEHPSLLKSSYLVQFSVPISLFQQFVDELQGKEIEITASNYSGFCQLCEEFGYSSLSAQLSVFRNSLGFRALLCDSS
jgi:hypothetical protein